MGNSSSSDGEKPAEAPEEPQQQSVGYMDMLRNGYGELVNAIIRPPRAEYVLADLGSDD